jgi:hypothetical protein
LTSCVDCHWIKESLKVRNDQSSTRKTLRDEFAMAALPALIPVLYGVGHDGPDSDRVNAAIRHAYRIADAAMVERVVK